MASAPTASRDSGGIASAEAVSLAERVIRFHLLRSDSLRKYGYVVKILHIINSFPRSGAEMALFRLALRQKSAGDDVHVISLLDEGVLREELRAAGIPLTAFQFRLSASLPREVLGLVRTIRRIRPDLVHTWLYHANLVGGVAARIAIPRVPVVWGIHHSYLKAASSKRTTRLVSRVLAVLSRIVPASIVYCATASRIAHEAAGYGNSRGVVIPNGVDTVEFAPDDGARQAIRRELAMPEDAKVVGTVSRWHPDKDVLTLIAAAAEAMDARDDIWLVLVGSRLDRENAELDRMVKATGHEHRIVRVGPRPDIPRVLNCLDFFALSSITEAFPVSIIEAMATGLPCVSTDVGDARIMIERSGRVVPIGDVRAFANAILDLAALEPAMRTVISEGARRRVESMYRIDVVVDQHRALYRSLIAGS